MNMQKSEQLNQLAKGLIKPDNSTKLIWDIYIILLLLYTAIWTPLQIAFIDNVPQFLQMVDLTMDCSFFFDIILSFNTTYFDEKGFLVVSRAKIACNYLSGWFFIDLVTAIPF